MGGDAGVEATVTGSIKALTGRTNGEEIEA